MSDNGGPTRDARMDSTAGNADATGGAKDNLQMPRTSTSRLATLDEVQNDTTDVSDPGGVLDSSDEPSPTRDNTAAPSTPRNGSRPRSPHTAPAFNRPDPDDHHTAGPGEGTDVVDFANRPRTDLPPGQVVNSPPRGRALQVAAALRHLQHATEHAPRRPTPMGRDESVPRLDIGPAQMTSRSPAPDKRFSVAESPLSPTATNADKDARQPTVQSAEEQASEERGTEDEPVEEEVIVIGVENGRGRLTTEQVTANATAASNSAPQSTASPAQETVDPTAQDDAEPDNTTDTSGSLTTSEMSRGRTRRAGTERVPRGEEQQGTALDAQALAFTPRSQTDRPSRTYASEDSGPPWEYQSGHATFTSGSMGPIGDARLPDVLSTDSSESLEPVSEQASAAPSLPVSPRVRMAAVARAARDSDEITPAGPDPSTEAHSAPIAREAQQDQPRSALTEMIAQQRQMQSGSVHAQGAVDHSAAITRPAPTARDVEQVAREGPALGRTQMQDPADQTLDDDLLRDQLLEEGRSSGPRELEEPPRSGLIGATAHAQGGNAVLPWVQNQAQAHAQYTHPDGTQTPAGAPSRNPDLPGLLEAITTMGRPNFRQDERATESSSPPEDEGWARTQQRPRIRVHLPPPRQPPAEQHQSEPLVFDMDDVPSPISAPPAELPDRLPRHQRSHSHEPLLESTPDRPPRQPTPSRQVPPQEQPRVRLPPRPAQLQPPPPPQQSLQPRLPEPARFLVGPDEPLSQASSADGWSHVDRGVDSADGRSRYDRRLDRQDREMGLPHRPRSLPGAEFETNASVPDARESSAYVNEDTHAHIGNGNDILGREVFEDELYEEQTAEALAAQAQRRRQVQQSLARRHEATQRRRPLFPTPTDAERSSAVFDEGIHADEVTQALTQQQGDRSLPSPPTSNASPTSPANAQQESSIFGTGTNDEPTGPDRSHAQDARLGKKPGLAEESDEEVEVIADGRTPEQRAAHPLPRSLNTGVPALGEAGSSTQRVPPTPPMGNFFEEALREPIFGVGPLGPGTHESPVSSVRSLALDGYHAPLDEATRHADTEVFADGYRPNANQPAASSDSNAGALPLVSLEQPARRTDSPAAPAPTAAVTSAPLDPAATPFVPGSGPAPSAQIENNAAETSPNFDAQSDETAVEEFPPHTFGSNGTAPTTFPRRPPAGGERGDHAAPRGPRNNVHSPRGGYRKVNNAESGQSSTPTSSPGDGASDSSTSAQENSILSSRRSCESPYRPSSRDKYNMYGGGPCRPRPRPPPPS